MSQRYDANQTASSSVLQPARFFELASRADVGSALLSQGRLRRSQPCQRHAIRRAADVGQSKLVTESDGLGLPAMLAADAEFDAFPGRPATLDSDSHQVTHPALVERLERVSLEHAVLEIAGQELSFRIVP